jgi:deoxyribonuclease-4
MEDLLFGTAGVPVSAKKRDSISGVERIEELGLGCMELEFVRGVKMGESAAKEVGKAASKLGIALSVHAPYFINLNSEEEKKVQASVERIMDSARVGYLCGAKDVVFHAAYYHKDSAKEVYRKVKSLLGEMVQKLREENVGVRLRPETTGKPTQFGTLEETLNLSQEVDNVLPCIDFAHIHARTGKYNSFQEFSEILERVEDALGREGVEDLQVHVSGIDYGAKGEKKHLILRESDFRYQELLKAFREFGAKGLIICESPNLEGDALLLQDSYRKID